ncbi:FHA domain-containing protein [Psychromicrobium xiongbiense]|uniref:FHA domain-containing protein n=1 Tax=Psychromicrobium xiongbiense TaxID=3051184 RepID=UPI002556EC78|nr:FHA domain-containing protein [Psychromicrobium sp. YIM S02556]
MSQIAYRSGSWLGIVRGTTVVILSQNTLPAAMAELWDFLQDAPPVHEVLNRVTASFGTELTGMPPFGLISWADQGRVVLRGDMTLRAADGDAPLVSGRDVTTWSERALSLDTPWILELAEPRGGSIDMPLGEGVVLLSRLSLQWAPAAVESAAPDLSRTLSSQDLPEAEEPLLPAAEPVPAEPVPAEPERPEHTPAVQAPPAPEAEPDDLFPAEVLEATGSYDHLWDRTVSRSIEDAAIRSVEGVEPARGAEVPPAPMVAPATSAPQTPPPVQHPAVVPASPPMPTLPTPSPLPSSSAPSPSGLIDSVPWRTPEAPDRAVVDPASDDLGTANYSPAEQEAVDHDGHTVARSELPLGSASASNAPSAPRVEQQPGVPMVLARLCASGHPNPPSSPRCTVCGLPVMGEAVMAPRPSLGQVRLSTGEVFALDRSIIVGRQPSVSRVQGHGVPRLVQVLSEAGDISRSHVEIRIEGWEVTLVDLKATNGTVLVRQGQAPRRLGQGEQALLLDGDIAELGENLSMRFEGLP